MVEIVDSVFVTSAPNIKAAPENSEQNEVVFMARSNVGKSSLLNSLTNRKSLAKVSATPGKTRLINYFDVTFINRDNNLKSIASFVDLPGFGYAKVSKSIKSDWEKSLTDYIAERREIKLFIHLIDARHPHLDIDKSVDDFLREIVGEDQTILHVFTKIDKLNQKEKSKLLVQYPGSLMVSNTKKKGLAKLTQKIYEILYKDNSEYDQV